MAAARRSALAPMPDIAVRPLKLLAVRPLHLRGVHRLLVLHQREFRPVFGDRDRILFAIRPQQERVCDDMHASAVRRPRSLDVDASLRGVCATIFRPKTHVDRVKGSLGMSGNRRAHHGLHRVHRLTDIHQHRSAFGLDRRGQREFIKVLTGFVPT